MSVHDALIIMGWLGFIIGFPLGIVVGLIARKPVDAKGAK